MAKSSKSSLLAHERSNSRKAAFNRLAKDGVISFKSIRQLAKALDIDQSRLSKALSLQRTEGASYHFTEQLARQIEHHFHLDWGILESKFITDWGDSDEFSISIYNKLRELYEVDTSEFSIEKDRAVEYGAGSEVYADYLISKDGTPYCVIELKPSKNLAKSLLTAILLGCQRIITFQEGEETHYFVNENRLIRQPEPLYPRKISYSGDDSEC